MSALIGHAKAARILGEEFIKAADKDGGWIGDGAEHVLRMMGEGYLASADRMEAAMRAEATGNQGDAP